MAAAAPRPQPLRPRPPARWRPPRPALTPAAAAASAAAPTGPQRTPLPPPLLLLVDGTNLGGLSQPRQGGGAAFGQPQAARFVAWLRCLQAAVRPAATLVAFDHKGSAATNARAQLLTRYLAARRTPASAPLDGFAHLAGPLAAAQLPGVLVGHAAYGWEADDALAGALAWARRQAPALSVVVASSDADMQQLLLDERVAWLELMQVASREHPSGLRLHGASEVAASHGLPAAAWPELMALTAGKPSASVPGAGLSVKLASTLLGRLGSLLAVLDAGEAGQLGAFGAAHQLLGGPSSAAAARRELARTSWQVLRLRADIAHQLPLAELQRTCAGLPGASSGVEAALPVRLELQAAVRLHPARLHHGQQCRPWLHALAAGLRSLGLHEQHADWTSPQGLSCDLLVRVVRSGSGSSGSSSGSSSTMPEAPDPDWLALQLLGPADLAKCPPPPGGWASEPDAAIRQLAAQLTQLGDSEARPGHAGRKLLAHASGGAKLRLALLRKAGWRVAAVPFHELPLAAGELAACGDGTASAALREYVTALLLASNA